MFISIALIHTLTRPNSRQNDTKSIKLRSKVLNKQKKRQAILTFFMHHLLLNYFMHIKYENKSFDTFCFTRHVKDLDALFIQN